MKKLQQAALRKALSEPNGKLDATRAQDGKLASGLRRAQRVKAGGKAGALLAMLVGLVLGESSPCPGVRSSQRQLVGISSERCLNNLSRL